jgi:hypothetical protein
MKMQKFHFLQICNFCKEYEHFAKIQKFCTLLEQIFGEITKILLSAKSNTEGSQRLSSLIL